MTEGVRDRGLVSRPVGHRRRAVLRRFGVGPRVASGRRRGRDAAPARSTRVGRPPGPDGAADRRSATRRTTATPGPPSDAGAGRRTRRVAPRPLGARGDALVGRRAVDRATSAARRRRASRRRTSPASGGSPGGCARALLVGGRRAGGHARDVGRPGAVDRRPLERDHASRAAASIPTMPASTDELARPAQRHRRLRGRDPLHALVLPGREHRLVVRHPGAARPDDRDAVVHHPDPEPVVAVPGRARHGPGRRPEPRA